METKIPPIAALVTGKWSTAGNYIGSTIRGEKFFINAAEMLKLGYDKDSVVPTLYASLGQSSWNRKDKEGNITDEKVVRDDAFAAFKSEDELIAAYNADKLLLAKANQALRKEATSLGLQESDVNAILTTSAI